MWQLATDSLVVTSHVIEGLQSNTVYYFRIGAILTNGEVLYSAMSDPVSGESETGE